MHILLEGTYGINNLGDDLLLKLSHDSLVSEGHKVIVAGRLADVPNTSLPPITVERLDWRKKIAVLRTCDLAVIGGGGQFNDNSSRTGGAHLALTFSICWLLRKRVLVCGTGFGPLRSVLARLIWGGLARTQRNSFALREPLGVDTFINLTGRQAKLCFDLIFSDFAMDSLSIRKLRAERARNPTAFGASGLVNFRRYRRNTFVESVLVEEIQATGSNLFGLSVDDHGDLGLDELWAYGIAKMYDYRGVESCLAQINAAPFVVTQRFHVLCACALLGVPVIPVCYAEKMKDFCRWMGMPYVTTEDANADALRIAVKECLAAGPVDLSRLKDRVDPLAWLNEQI